MVHPSTNPRSSIGVGITGAMAPQSAAYDYSMIITSNHSFSSPILESKCLIYYQMRSGEGFNRRGMPLTAKIEKTLIDASNGVAESTKNLPDVFHLYNTSDLDFLN